MSLMEDTAGGPADIDEDPVDQWGDLYEDESDQKEKTHESDFQSDEESDDDENVSEQAKKSHNENSDGDAFMEDANSSDLDSNSGNSSEEPEIEENEIVAGFGKLENNFGNVEDEDDDNSIEDYGIFIDDESEDETTEEIDESHASKKRKKGNDDSGQPVFADAEEYEAIIAKSFIDLKNVGKVDVE